MLDSRSERSYITADLSQQLNLQILGSETMRVFPLSGRKQVTMASKRVETLLVFQDRMRKTVTTNAIPFLTPNAKKKIRELAGNNCESAKIEVLMWLDYYWEVLQKAKIFTQNDNYFCNNGTFETFMTSKETDFLKSEETNLSIMKRLNQVLKLNVVPAQLSETELEEF